MLTPPADRAASAVSRLVVAAVLVVSVLAVSRQAQAHSPHDDIRDIAVSPSYAEDRTLLVISRGRLQRSTDGGDTWQDLVRGFGRAPLTRVTISPVDEERVFVTTNGGGVYRSTDGGDTWAPANTGIENLSLREVATSPTSAALVLVAGPRGALHRSTDGGDTWASIDGFDAITALEFLLDGSGRLVAGESTGRLSVSDDGGATWQEATAGEGAPITAVAAGEGRSAATVVAATASGRVLRSTDAGSTFEVMALGVPGDQPQGIAVSSQDDQVVWLSTASDGTLQSTDGGTTWTRRADGLTKSEQADEVDVPHFRGLVAARAGDGEVLFLAGFDGLFRSGDEGRSWEPIETAGDFIAGLAVSPSFTTDRTVVVMSYVKGGFISHDAGRTWRTMNDGLRYDRLSEGNRLLPLRRAHNVAFSPDFAHDRTIFSAVWPRLIKSTDAGKTWVQVQVEEPTPEWSPLRQYVLAVSPTYAVDRTVFTGDRYGQIFRSGDGGGPGTWSAVGTVDGRVRTLAISPTFRSDGVIFAGSVGGVFKSVDRGATWSPTGPGRSPLATGGEIDPAPLLSMSPAFATDGTIFAGTAAGLFVTRDAGATWSEVRTGALSGTTDVAAVSVSPAFANDGTVLVSVTGEGLYRSTDAGASFAEVGQELTAANRVITDYDNPTSQPIQFSQSFVQDRTVFAYAGRDVLRSVDGGVSWEVLALPTIEDVAESLGVEADARSRGGEPAPSDPDGGRWTVEAPFGVLSARRAVAAAGVGVTALLLLALLGVGRSWPRLPRWGLRLIGGLVAGVAATTVLAA